MSKVKLMLGDNIASLKKLPDNSIDSIVSDPPYGLSFMNKKWDYDVPSVEFWREVYRVLKPGGHILSFGGTRTYHRMVVNIEDAGFDIRDQVMWLYGSGFPKSHNIGKAVDKLETKGNSQYEGFGTALKPANEPICLARKPLSEKSIAENVLKWNTGGINIDGCRIATEDKLQKLIHQEGCTERTLYVPDKRQNGKKIEHIDSGLGRFPANLLLDEEAAELLDEQSGISKSGKYKGEGSKSGGIWNKSTGLPAGVEYGDKGGASRFFYVAKVSKAERNAGLDNFEEKKKEYETTTRTNKETADKYGCERKVTAKNTHPTVKPINLMTYLCRLITPPGGIVLDPFMGSGSTGIAARLEGFKFCGMEMDKDYFDIASARIENYEEYRKFIKK